MINGSALKEIEIQGHTGKVSGGFLKLIGKFSDNTINFSGDWWALTIRILAYILKVSYPELFSSITAILGRVFMLDFARFLHIPGLDLSTSEWTQQAATAMQEAYSAGLEKNKLTLHPLGKAGQHRRLPSKDLAELGASMIGSNKDYDYDPPKKQNTKPIFSVHN